MRRLLIINSACIRSAIGFRVYQKADEVVVASLATLEKVAVDATVRVNDPVWVPE